MKAKYRIERGINRVDRLRYNGITHLFNGSKVRWYHENKPIGSLFIKTSEYLFDRPILTSILILGFLRIIAFLCAE